MLYESIQDVFDHFVRPVADGMCLGLAIGVLITGGISTHQRITACAAIVLVAACGLESLVRRLRAAGEA